MKLELKKISETEALLYFSQPLLLVGSFLATKKNTEYSLLLPIISEEMTKRLLLTADFLYLECYQKQQLDDLILIASAELDDWSTVSLKQEEMLSDDTEEKIDIILRVVVAPFLQRDGGDIQRVKIQDNILSVRFLGKCQSCPYAQRTLKECVEKNIIHYFPYIRGVVLV